MPVCSLRRHCALSGVHAGRLLSHLESLARLAHQLQLQIGYLESLETQVDDFTHQLMSAALPGSPLMHVVQPIPEQPEHVNPDTEVTSWKGCQGSTSRQEVSAKSRNRGGGGGPGRMKRPGQHTTGEEAAALFTDDMTTVMVRNVTTCCNPETFLDAVRDAGFERTFDFFYTPMNCRTKKNHGYCFLNFLSASRAREFMQVFHGNKLGRRHNRQKALEIIPAALQGLEKNMSAVKGSSDRIKNKWFRAMVFGTSEEELCTGEDA